MQPRLAATVILLREPYEVLMVKRNETLAFMGGYWVFPGGKVEAEDRSPEQAARRELREEVAIALDPDAELIPFARWITPDGLPKRFDTWFFLTLASAAVARDAPVVDGDEIVDFRWISPQTALADGSPIAFPTQKQLELLATHPSAAAAIGASRGRRIEPIQPKIIHNDGSPVIIIP